MEFYVQHPRFLVAVDCVIFGYEEGELKLLIYPRAFEPEKGKWSLMGGFIQQAESSDEAAARVLKETTGLNEIFLEQVSTFSASDREPSERVISVAYFALIKIERYKKNKTREFGAKWWPVNELPPLIFDHNEMVLQSLKKLQQKAGHSLVGSELLPSKFTLLQLRKLYEAIYQRSFDPGNFRKKMLSLGALEKLDQKNSTESKKGAYYYRVKPDKTELELERIIKY
ncbi:ADP-ribose pyrophosphatase YjhB, NUDIX family [Mariniphaga anaerophila]|uniref:ADP-ribose pyrophosphatase YjhB, NUDIX family n=1 Tax=Mariniphaga anaerophila TaxID=1484053 RepID=A0A1M4XX46_9BACT|nr:NUDIX domain-containing protein [Mariniphaga anaerophila]SHE97822.1 ADP-ribose pyrophosphatase YjhB, NUDIX family [Mariniphaga anaerophila]